MAREVRYSTKVWPDCSLNSGDGAEVAPGHFWLVSPRLWQTSAKVGEAGYGVTYDMVDESSSAVAREVPRATA